MALSIDIDKNTCIKCSKCVKVCPASVFRFDTNQKEIIAEHPENCIVCGHCVAACPNGSVVHSGFPEDKVHTIDRKKLPTPDQTLLLMQARRSNRAFSKKPVPQEYIDLILDAAHRAPTASNQQQVNFTVVTDPEVLKAVIKNTIDIFNAIKNKINNPLVRPLIKRFMPNVYRMIPRFEALKQRFDNGEDPILRNATAVIFIHSPKKNMFGCHDCNLAYQNGSLMAESLGVSQVYTGFVVNAMSRDKKNVFAKLLGTDETIHAGLAIGMPEFLFMKYIDKKDIVVNHI